MKILSVTFLAVALCCAHAYAASQFDIPQVSKKPIPSQPQDTEGTVLSPDVADRTDHRKGVNNLPLTDLERARALTQEAAPKTKKYEYREPAKDKEAPKVEATTGTEDKTAEDGKTPVVSRDKKDAVSDAPAKKTKKSNYKDSISYKNTSKSSENESDE